jgi:hypothetical protein
MAAIRFGLIGMGKHGMRYTQHLMRDVEGAEGSHWGTRSFSLLVDNRWTTEL